MNITKSPSFLKSNLKKTFRAIDYIAVFSLQHVGFKLKYAAMLFYFPIDVSSLLLNCVKNLHYVIFPLGSLERAAENLNYASQLVFPHYLLTRKF